MSATRLESLWSEHLPALLGYALRRTASREDAADVVAEVYVVAWRRIDDVPADPEARPWLFGVARKVLANHHRGEQRRTALSLRLAIHLDELTPEPVRDDHPEVHEALANLTDRDRELITLTAWDGLTPTEAATVLGIPASTVRVRLHRAREKLREDLKRSAAQGHVEHEGRSAFPQNPRIEVTR